MTSVLREAPPAGPSDGIPRLELTEWASRYGLVAGITTAHDGFSLDMGAELTSFLARVVERTAERWPVL